MMKKGMLSLLCAATIIIAGLMSSCTPSEPDLKRTDYLKLVHGTVGLTADKAEKTLTRKGFTETENSIKADGLEALLADKTYKFVSKDSTVCLLVGLVIRNDSVKQYMLSAELDGYKHAEEAQKLYRNWSSYAYENIFADITLWFATSGNLTEDLTGMQLYTDGALANTLQQMLELYHASGEMDEDVYEQLKSAFEHKRADFDAEMLSSAFLVSENATETFTHSTSTIDMMSLASGDFMRNMKGLVGALHGEAEEENGIKNRTITFVFMGEQDLNKYMERFAQTEE